MGSIQFLLILPRNYDGMSLRLMSHDDVTVCRLCVATLCFNSTAEPLCGASWVLSCVFMLIYLCPCTAAKFNNNAYETLIIHLSSQR